jgi:hypothetical protein
MPNGYFERIDATPIRLRLNLTDPVQTITQGTVIYADYNTYKDIVGFRFVGWTKPDVNPPSISKDAAKPTHVYKTDAVSIVTVRGEKQAPHKEHIRKLAEQKEQEKATEIKVIEEMDAIPELEKPLFESDETKDKQGIIDYLKKFTQKNWFIMRKEDARSYMDRLGIDYSNIANNRGEFIKFLKEKIKEM